MATNERPLEWISSSHKDLMALSADVRRFFGYALSLAQAGDQHDAAKLLKGFGSAGVLDVVEYDRSGTYRAVYTVKFEEAVFVLHCFQNKEQDWNRNTERGYSHHPRQAESGRGTCKGATK